MNAYQVIRTISVTEKSSHQTEDGKYTFIIDTNANKNQVRAAVETLFSRKVDAVNIMNRLGKVKRSRFGQGKKPDWKKAVVTLKPGQEPIEFF